MSDADVEEYCDHPGQCIPKLPIDLSSCSDTACSQHNTLIDEYADKLVSTLITCASCCFPAQLSSSQTLVGWKDSCKDLKQDADFWYKVWREAGCPLTGALSDVRNSTKMKYKSSVRRLKRRQNQVTRDKLAKSFTKRKKTGFWSAIKQLKHKSTSQVPVVDGCADPSEIADIFASNMSGLLNTHSSALRDSMLVAMKSSLTHN